MKLSLNDIYDKIDKAVIYFAQDNPVDKWKIQKGVFYFLWLESRNREDFIDLAKKIQIHPNKQGPYSETIDGEVELLLRDGFLNAIEPQSKAFPVIASEKGLAEFSKDISPKEELVLSEIKDILDVLDSYEVLFFIYFNPYIPEDIKSYFVSKSEIKEGLLNKKDKYIKKLLDCEIIDELTASEILKKANLMVQ